MRDNLQSRVPNVEAVEELEVVERNLFREVESSLVGLEIVTNTLRVLEQRSLERPFHSCLFVSCGNHKEHSTPTDGFVGNSTTSRQVNSKMHDEINKGSDHERVKQRLTALSLKMHELVKALRHMHLVTQTFDPPRMSTTIQDDSTLSPAYQYLPFFLDGDQLFAVRVSTVQEVVRAEKLVISAERPGRTRRAINLHGTVVPVIDLNTYLGRGASEVTEDSLIVILTLGQSCLGITVGGIGKVLSVTPTSIDLAPTETMEAYSGFVSGTIKREGHTIILLDIIKGLMMSKLA